ncbi:hypothetical protein WG29040_00310 [Pseudomonas sp. PAMC 29040]|nr:hypothetical protein WG29040_00310 [Pseudomonas sp. PAMC 29040]
MWDWPRWWVAISLSPRAEPAPGSSHTGTYPFYVSRLFTGFALTASPFWQTPQKEPKGLCPTIRPSSPRLARCPHSGAVVGIRVVPAIE